MKSRGLLTVLACLLLIGCGFQLRSANDSAVPTPPAAMTPTIPLASLQSHKSNE